MCNALKEIMAPEIEAEVKAAVEAKEAEIAAEMEAAMEANEAEKKNILDNVSKAIKLIKSGKSENELRNEGIPDEVISVVLQVD